MKLNLKIDDLIVPVEVEEFGNLLIFPKFDDDGIAIFRTYKPIVSTKMDELYEIFYLVEMRQSIMDILKCEKCPEEVSGGHKPDCDSCYNTGINQEKIDSIIDELKENDIGLIQEVEFTKEQPVDFEFEYEIRDDSDFEMFFSLDGYSNILKLASGEYDMFSWDDDNQIDIIIEDLSEYNLKVITDKLSCDCEKKCETIKCLIENHDYDDVVRRSLRSAYMRWCNDGASDELAERIIEKLNQIGEATFDGEHFLLKIRTSVHELGVEDVIQYMLASGEPSKVVVQHVLEDNLERFSYSLIIDNMRYYHPTNYEDLSEYVDSSLEANI